MFVITSQSKCKGLGSRYRNKSIGAMIYDKIPQLAQFLIGKVDMNTVRHRLEALVVELSVYCLSPARKISMALLD